METIWALITEKGEWVGRYIAPISKEKEFIDSRANDCFSKLMTSDEIGSDLIEDL